jgi:hypothetical protein
MVRGHEQASMMVLVGMSHYHEMQGGWMQFQLQAAKCAQTKTFACIWDCHKQCTCFQLLKPLNVSDMPHKQELKHKPCSTGSKGCRGCGAYTCLDSCTTTTTGAYVMLVE